MVYVTHDQSEALTMSDRIAVFHLGRIQQVADPQTIYERPANLFVASFIGESNRLPAQLAESHGDGRCTARLATARCCAASPRRPAARPGGPWSRCGRSASR